ncbi:aldehyde dehydrogenase family protein [Streptomyces sp. HD]|nr:aldehyde dehydrogenase family protein [Streptomyces sp. HD]MDC0768922.1 aldehyde dehydrogenase family protein [Streptomyces sp. HD]
MVFPDADLAAAAAALRVAGFWNSGQECGAACRVLVHESVAEESWTNSWARYGSWPSVSLVPGTTSRSGPWFRRRTSSGSRGTWSGRRAKAFECGGRRGSRRARLFRGPDGAGRGARRGRGRP